MKKVLLVTQSEVAVSEIDTRGPRDGELVVRLQMSVEQEKVSRKLRSVIIPLDHAEALGKSLIRQVADARKLHQAIHAPL